MNLYEGSVCERRPRLMRLLAGVLGVVLFSSIFANWYSVAAAQSNIAATPERLQCQDVFGEARLGVNLTGVADTVSPGDSLEGVISLQYTGDIPLYGMNVYVAFGPSADDEQVLNAPLQFLQVAEAVVLAVGADHQYEFTIPTPSSLLEEAYTVSVYVSQHDHNTQLGLASYGREAVATQPVSVVGDSTDGPRFVEGSLKVDAEVIGDASYYILSKVEPVPAEITVTNDAAQTSHGEIVWELYEGMTAQTGNLVTSYTDTFKLISGFSKTSTFNLKHTIETLEDRHDVLTNEQLQASSYVLRVALSVDGEVHERVAYPLVRDVESLVATEPILEYLHVYPNQNTAAACVSFVPDVFSVGSSKEVLDIAVIATQKGAEVARSETRLVAEEYQRHGVFKSAAVRGVSAHLPLRDVGPGPHELTAVLITGIDNPAFPLPKHIVRVIDKIEYQYECVDECSEHSTSVATPSSSQSVTITPVIKILILVALFGALLTVLFAARSFVSTRSSHDEEMDVSTDERDDESRSEPGDDIEPDVESDK